MADTGIGQEKEIANHMMNPRYILTLLLLSLCYIAEAQPNPNRLINEGNKLYEQKKYKEAAVDYQRALQRNPTNVPGIFNLGNTLYQQGQFDASRQVLSNVSKVAKTKEEKAGAHYNIGNSYMQEKKWEDAIAAYKNTLRNNPQDVDAKYNLSYAEQMLKKQGGGKNNKQDKNKDNKQDQKNQQNKDNKKDDKNNKDQQNQDNKDKQDKKDDKDQQQPEGQPSKLSKQQADQLLNALQQEEKKLQDKKQQQKGVPVKMEKDW